MLQRVSRVLFSCQKSFRTGLKIIFVPKKSQSQGATAAKAEESSFRDKNCAFEKPPLDIHTLSMRPFFFLINQFFGRYSRLGTVIFWLVSEQISKNVGIEKVSKFFSSWNQSKKKWYQKSLGTGLKKIFYRHKVSFRFWVSSHTVCY